MNSSDNKALAFTKASACGNDFLIVQGGEDFGDLILAILARSAGVYAIAIMESAQTAWNGRFPDARRMCALRLFNADGSEAEISGNGTRCVAAEICSRTGEDGNRDSAPRRSEDVSR